MKKAIKIDEGDNVATVTSDVSNGEEVTVLSPEGAVVLRTKALGAISFGHKIALIPFNGGDEVIKYGEIIGVASQPIEVGAWVHTHNVESARVPTSALRKESP